MFPNGDFAEFSSYNIPLEKLRFNAAGYCNAGPSRPPYHLVPDAYAAGAEESGRRWAEIAEEVTERIAQATTTGSRNDNERSPR